VGADQLKHFGRIVVAWSFELLTRLVVDHRAGVFLIAQPGQHGASPPAPAAGRQDPVVVQSLRDLVFGVIQVDKLVEDATDDGDLDWRAFNQSDALVLDSLPLALVHDVERLAFLVQQ
jgi:hypothetical protein